MNCRDFDDLLSSGAGNYRETPDAAEHLASCDDCRSLMRLLDESAATQAHFESQLKHIQARIVRDLKPVRPLAPYRLLLFTCAIIFLCVVAAGAMPFGMNGWAALNVAQRIAIFAALAASAALLAISLVGQMAPGSKFSFAPATLPIGILTALVFIIFLTFRARGEAAFVASGLMCLRNGLTYSIPAAFLFWLLLRRGAMLYPKLIGAAAGGLAGLVGLSVLELNCPNLNAFHILVWHWGVVLISAVAGAVLGAAVEYAERWHNSKISSLRVD